MKRSLLLWPFLGLFLLLHTGASAQRITISGQITGDAAKILKELQFISDGKMQSLPLNKEDLTYSGSLKVLEPQFVEVKAGNTKPQFYYMIPGDSISLNVDKPSLQESIVTISGSRYAKFQEMVNSYFNMLQEKGIDIQTREWQLFLFADNSSMVFAEQKLKEEMKKNAELITAFPNFQADMDLFMKNFRVYTEIDRLSLIELEKALGDIQAAHVTQRALNIPFFKDCLTDLTNAYSARTLEKYGIAIDFIKQKNVSQFIAAEALVKYIDNPSIRSYIFADKLKIELPTNGLKNETFVNFLLDHSEQFVKDFYKDRLETLRANKTPDLNVARKRAFDFKLKDADGKVYTLDDFKGKMLFIDFWASWCAPCKAQIPYQKELEKAYAGKDVVFMNVSLDKSKEAWLKAVKEEDLHGYVLRADGDFKNDFPKAYAIESIPRYMLVDAFGNIISDNMMKPQNKKEIMAVFDEELYAKSTNEIVEKHMKALGADVLAQNGLYTEYRQSMVSFGSTNQLYYKYPTRLKTISQFEETEQMLMILGKEFFKPKQFLMNDGKFITNNPNQSDIRSTWVNKLGGLELYLRKSLDHSVIKFATEGSATDSNYVLKLMQDGNIEKYYINKKTYLLDKFTRITTNVDARKGGGTIETSIMYEDYRNVGGLMLPFKINQANIVTIKLEKAELRPLEDALFR